MNKIFLQLSLVLLMSQKECDADDHHGLVQHRRSFLKHDDEVSDEISDEKQKDFAR